MSEFYEDEGLTMEQASPDLNEGNDTPESAESDGGFEFTETQPEPKADNRKETKKVSDRINAIRAENDATVQSLKDQIEGLKRENLRYRAMEEGLTEEELATRDRMEEENFRNALHNDPEFLALQQRDFERQKAEVLTQLQTEFPKDGIDDLETLPQDFFRMLQAGVSPVAAYRASVADAQKPAPPSTGSVKSQGETAKGNLTEDQMLSMTAEEWADWLNENET